MKSVRTPIAEISFDKPESILHIKVLEGAEMNLNNTQAHYEKIKSLVGNKKYLALVNAANYYRVEKAAWLYASSKEIIGNRVAVAHYNSTFANKLATNFFIASYKTAMPMRIFNTKQGALKWLKSHKFKEN